MKTNTNSSFKSFKEIVQDARQSFNNAAPHYSCPDSEQLLCYACGETTPKQIDTMAAHLHGCEDCRMTVLRIEADQVLWDDLFQHSPEAALSQALGDKGRQEINALIVTSQKVLVKTNKIPKGKPSRKTRLSRSSKAGY